MVAFRSIDRSIRHRVTSVDVARHAGVSQSTVSLVFSGKGHGRVSETTQDRVRRCARELGYRPTSPRRLCGSGRRARSRCWCPT